MRWPWRRRVRPAADTEASRERQDAEAALVEVEAGDLTARRIAAALRRARERNDFAQMLADALRGHV